MNDYYRFQESDAFRFKDSVRIKAKRVGNELTFGFCPYCLGGSSKDRDTFSINLTTGQFECKRSSCGSKGNIITLARDFPDFKLPNDVDTYYNINGKSEKFKKFRNAHKKIEVRPKAIEYLNARSIPTDVIQKYEITTMPNNENVLVFPFKDETGELTFVKYRNISEKNTGSKEWCEKGNTKKILFGMNHCEDFETLVITEGQIDSLSCAAAGIKNSVSVPTGKNGFTWKPNVWNWLVKFNEIVVFGDNENGKITLSKEISQFFPKRVRIVKVEDYHGHKDANEILMSIGAEAIQKAVENAEPIVSLRIRNLADVERVNLQEITSYPIGFRTIDADIGRGFHDGELIILTGKCGEGKSTFASIIVGRMIQNGLKCFCYSGELPDYMFKEWLNYQFSGTKHLNDDDVKKFNDWVRNKCYIYDNSAVIDEKETLFELMEQAVRDLGCKFVLIDNLMTAMEDKQDADLFRQQSAFVSRLTKFAKGFNIIVLLVAHPRKGIGIDNDSISGSGDITNRANLVLRYQRKKGSKEQSCIYITKNRTTGTLRTDEDSAIVVSYDSSNMRICENGKDFDEFTTGNDGFTNIDDLSEETIDMLDIPF